MVTIQIEIEEKDMPEKGATTMHISKKTIVDDASSLDEKRMAILLDSLLKTALQRFAKAAGHGMSELDNGDTQHGEDH